MKKTDKIGVEIYLKQYEDMFKQYQELLNKGMGNHKDMLTSIMREQLDINTSNNEKKLGKVITVLCEDYDPVAQVHFGRSAADAPEIDGKVYFRAEKRIAPGSFVKVKVREVLDYDLMGRAITEN